MRFPPHRICKKLQLIENIGFCKLYDIHCKCFLCEIVKKCREGQHLCKYQRYHLKKIDQLAVTHFLESLIEISNSILDESLQKETLENQIIILLFLREIWLMSTFFAPSDYICIPFINKRLEKYWINPRQFSKEDFDYKKWSKGLYVSEFIVSKLLVLSAFFEEWQTLFSNGDAILYFNQFYFEKLYDIIVKGNHEDHKLLILDFLKEEFSPPKSENEILNKEEPQPTISSLLQFLSLSKEKMQNVYIWSLKNGINPCNGFIHLDEAVTQLDEHYLKIGRDGHGSILDCMNVVYPFQLNLLHLLQNIVTREAIYKQKKDFFKTFYATYSEKVRRPQLKSDALSIINNRTWIWDHAIHSVKELWEKEEIVNSDLISEYSQIWGTLLKDGVLFGSILFFGLISMFYDDLFQTTKEKGTYFEEYKSNVIMFPGNS